MERATLRKLLGEIAESGKSARYPGELKAAAVEYLRNRRAAGVEAWDIARELGMVTSTLLRWDQAAPVTAPAPAATDDAVPALDDGAAPANLDERAAQFRANVNKAGVKRGQPYTEELRREALAYAEACQAEGAPASAIAKALGVSAEALSRWQTGKSWRRRADQGGFRPVAVDDEAPRHRGIVVHAGALRIEGFDVDGVVELLRRLG